MRQRSGTETEARGTSGEGGSTCLGSIGGSAYLSGLLIGRVRSTEASVASAALVSAALLSSSFVSVTCAPAQTGNASMQAIVSVFISGAQFISQSVADILFIRAVKRRLRTLHIAQARAQTLRLNIVGAHIFWRVTDPVVQDFRCIV